MSARHPRARAQEQERAHLWHGAALHRDHPAQVLVILRLEVRHQIVDDLQPRVTDQQEGDRRGEEGGKWTICAEGSSAIESEKEGGNAATV